MLADPADRKVLEQSERDLGSRGDSIRRPRALSTAELGEATSGDRDKLTRLKESLKRRVEDGEATDMEVRMLRGLCRQLGDPTCAK